MRVQSQKAVKTAGVQTEVHDGFTVLLTLDARDTCRLYGHLTSALQVPDAAFRGLRIDSQGQLGRCCLCGGLLPVWVPCMRSEVRRRV